MGTPNSTPNPDLLINENVGKTVIPFYYNLADITAVVMGGWAPTFRGRIIATFFETHKAVTTAAKAATLTPSINGTNLTAASGNGGAVALTSANCIAQTSTAGRVDGTAITGGNTFEEGDYILLTASSVTAFAEGSGQFCLVVVNDDTQNAVAAASFGLRSANPE